MIKIDLHIHTIPTSSDASFTFDISALQRYVEKLGIDAIAITNHNIFDKVQYLQICQALPNTVVFPGIEIDLDSGHMLVIADNLTPEKIHSFTQVCSQVSALNISETTSLDIDRFKALFANLEDYILIPHYQKDPLLSELVINSFTPHITAGEVSSVKKFIQCIKSEKLLVPVLFSDSRLRLDMHDFTTKQTYIDIHHTNVTFAGIKYCLSDKKKVFLTKEEGNDYFQVSDDGLKLSTGLNVVLGERSSGKTFTLDKIRTALGKDNVKYIEQFSLLQNNTSRFNESSKKRNIQIFDKYLFEFKGVVDDVIDINLEKDDNQLQEYIDTLLKYAREGEREDVFSRTTLFAETCFGQHKLENLDSLINAITIIEDNQEYKDEINQCIDNIVLIQLKRKLINQYLKKQEANLKLKWINSLINTIKSELGTRTSATMPKDVDFYEILKHKNAVVKFQLIVNSIRIPRNIDSSIFKKFKITADTRSFVNATDLKSSYTKQVSLVEVFEFYNNPYQYLKELIKCGIEKSEIYKLFVTVDFKTLNKYGLEVSGGERSEFNLLQEIEDAIQYDILLIDEPESSFDNLFLKNEVNSLLKDISGSIPVIIVTHNNTVGASIKPSFILYTKREIINNKPEFKIYLGHPTDKQLRSSTGDTINSYDILLNCLEAGEEEYNKRKTETYEILKN